MTQHDLEATSREFETQMAVAEARMRCRGGSKAGTSTDRVKPLKFDGSTSREVFHHQFRAMANHNDWTSCERAMHLFTILQGQAANVGAL
jgi:hypothetical protein